MKKKLITSLAIMLFLNICLCAQSLKEAIRYTNAIYPLISEAEFDTAVDYSIKLSQLSPALFRDKIHTEISQLILSDRLHKNTSEYLKLLYQTNNNGVVEIIKPLITLNSIIENTDKDSIRTLLKDFLISLPDTCNYFSKTESYGLLMIKQMELKGINDILLRDKLIQKIIQNLMTNKTIESGKVVSPTNIKERAWARYILSYSNYLLYKNNPDGHNAEEYLKLSASFSPDLQDKQVKQAYFYEASMLTGNTKNIGFEEEYIDYLIKKNRQKEALALLTSKTISEPTDINLDILRTLFSDIETEGTFDNYWLKEIELVAKQAPAISVKLSDSTSISFIPTGKWFYFDVWGTWCSPCIRELPELVSRQRSYDG